MSRRNQIERAAHHVLASGGFASASIAAVARAADCSAGLIYTYYENRDELLRIVFARASGHELAVVEAAIGQAADAGGVIDAVVDVFIYRAVTGRTLAHALLLEEVPASVQTERGALRRGYVSAISSRLQHLSGADIPAEVVARSLVGAIAENLVDVLDPTRDPPSSSEVEELIASLSRFARTAIGEQ